MDFHGRPPMGGPRPPMPKEREHGPHAKERTLEEMAVAKWLTRDNAHFLSENGLLYLPNDGEKVRVTLYRAFPYECPDEYLSVMNEELEEVGIIRSLSDFEGETKELLRQELDRRYFVRKILSVVATRDRYGFSYWKVMTEEGKIEFSLRDPFKSIVHTADDRLVFLDVDGNRYEIPSVSSLDGKSYRLVELYL